MKTTLKALLLALVGMFLPTTGMSEPQYEAHNSGIRVVVYSEECQLKEVINLPRKATWTENGKTIEGCVGAIPIGIAIFYFADKTVVAIPMNQFVRVTSA